MTRSRLYIIVCALLLACPASAQYETGGVVKTILSNGLTILIREEPEARTAAIKVFVRVGAQDERESPGIGQLLAGSILAGTETRSSAKLARLVSEVGGNFQASWHWDYIEVYAVTIPELCDDTIALLSDSIRNSRLDGDALEYSRAALLKSISRQDEDAFNSAHTALSRVIHRGSPYDRCYLGDEEKIKAVTREQLKAFYEKNFTADRTIISVVGNVKASSVSRKVEACFLNMPRGRVRTGDGPSYITSMGELAVEHPGPATYVLMGYPVPGVEDAEYPAASIANTLLGGNKSSLLFRSLREDRGLGYQVGSLYPAMRRASHIALFAGLDSSRTDAAVLQEVRETMLAQVRILCEGGFTDDDLERAKRFLIGHHALKRERTRDRAHSLGWCEAIGLGYQYDFQYSANIRRVSRQDVLDFCRRHLTSTPSMVVQSPSGALASD